MRLSEYAIKYGKVAALKAVGEEELALGLIKSIAYQNHVVRTEGIMPFEDRPEQTQNFLRFANQDINNADDFLLENRKVEVDSPTLETLEEIIVDLDYQIITSVSLEDAEPIILMKDRVAAEIRDRVVFFNDCLTEEE